MFPRYKPTSAGSQRACRFDSEPRLRSGLTLVELLIATAIMGILAVVLSGLATAVNQSWKYTEGHGLANQHSRVAIERITRAVRGATTAEDYPGFVVASETVAAWRFPDTLIVWYPDGSPVNPDGPPLVSECVMFCPDPDNPNLLLEITAPSDNATVPPFAEVSAGTWNSEIAAIKSSSSSRRVVLSNLVRTGTVSGTGGGERGAIRFEQVLRPSESEWADYETASLAWEDMSWPLGMYGSQTGVRYTWLRCELQLMPGKVAAAEDTQGQQALPFFGSAGLYFKVDRP